MLWDDHSQIYSGSAECFRYDDLPRSRGTCAEETASLPVFNLLSGTKRFELYLIDGLYQEKIGAFVGVNGLKDSEVSNFSIEEGTLQKIVLDNAAEKCLVSDATKFDHSDFYNFYDLRQIDKLFTDSTLSAELKSYYQQFTKIIQ